MGLSGLGRAVGRVLFTSVLVAVVGVPALASADPALSEKWKPSLSERSGEHGWLGSWIIDDKCSKKGLAPCGKLGDVLGGKTASWPQDFFADALKVEMGVGRNSGAQSAVCIEAYGCDLLDFALEMLAAKGTPEAGALLVPWLAEESKWKGGPMVTWRPMFIRFLAWYGDKAQAPLVTAMASFIDPSRNSNALVIEAAAWLLSAWGDKSLLPTCAKVLAGEVRGDGVDNAQRACAFYALRVGDSSLKAKIAEVGGNGYLNVVLRAAVGDKSQVPAWKKEAEILKKSPDHGRAAIYNAGLAALGDKGAMTTALAGIKTCKAAVVREQARAALLLETTRFGAEARKALAGCLGKLGDTDIEGRALAHAAYVQLRKGDAAALPAMAKALASSDDDVVAEAADLLSGDWGSVGVNGHSKGLNGGVPVKGVGALIQATLAKGKTEARNELGLAWAMQRVHGAD